MKRLLLWCEDRPGLILAVSAIVFLSLSYGQDGISLDSATYAVTARNMAEHGSWFNPDYTEFYHSKFAEHPPLVMWAQGLIFLVIDPNDSSARIFGAMCTIGCILLIYLIGALVADKNYGFLSGLVLLLTYNFMQIGNSTMLDVPLTFFILAALYGLIQMWQAEVTDKLSALTGLALGCAWLTKGVVTMPLWLSLLVAVLIWKRDWLKNKKFWLMLGLALALVVLHLVLDQIFADGRFFHHYFFVQIVRKFGAAAAHADHDWLQVVRLFATLYLPFVIFLPIGLIYLIRKKIKAIYPILITLLFFFIFYSIPAVLYNHYFAPFYALSAPIVACFFYQFLKPHWIRKLAFGFLIVWIAAAVVVKITGVRLQSIRTPEIYSLNEQMNRLLGNSPTRYGLTVDVNGPNWDWVAKAAWYWRSDIQNAGSVADAAALMDTIDFAYVLLDAKQTDIKDSLTNYTKEELITAIENANVTVLVKKKM